MARRAILIVDDYTTKCSRCGKGARIQDTHHTRLLSGWGTPAPHDRPCGEPFVAISTRRLGVTAEDLRALRPDLPAYAAGDLPAELKER
ncbi:MULTISPECIES: hypothetical protein [unclassified Streptomyces]|uniref:hypothetical protein n=1 Tax=unclassified Streptomyces TaxID=2593676 RepID=UPI000CD5063B|nr:MULTISPECIES: hypothetical protein [unclassified Streptomyces]AWL39681.1 hypothetical protein B9S64_17460 [Streptomyces sp. SM18]